MTLGTYITCGAIAAQIIPTVLFRELGGGTWTIAHQHGTVGPSSLSPGFTGIDGIPSGNFLVAVGSVLYKSASLGATGILSWYDGSSWHDDTTIPASYRFTDVYVPAAGSAYITGYDSAVGNTGKIWSWTPGGGLVEVLSKYLAGTNTQVSFWHIRGTGPTNIFASLVFHTNVAAEPRWYTHFDGVNWSWCTTPWSAVTDYKIGDVAYSGWESGANNFSSYTAILDNKNVVMKSNPSTWRRNCLQIHPQTTFGWVNAFSEWYSSIPVYAYKLIYGSPNDTLSQIGSIGGSLTRVPFGGVVGTENYMLAGVLVSPVTYHLYKYTAAGGLVSVLSTSNRLSQVAIAADELNVVQLAEAGNNVYIAESADAGDTWGAFTQIPGYIRPGGVFFADVLPQVNGNQTPTPNPRTPSSSKIYPFVIQSIRDADEADGDLLLKRWTEGLDEQWNETDRKIRDLATLIDPETCPSEAVAFLGWIVGLTKELEGLTGGISESDYRQLIAIAVRMWKKKGSGLGLVETLASISGYDVRYLTWFFFRIILGEFELGHAEFDVDPWLLDQPGMSPGVAPDALVVERLLRGDVLPSAADPIWTYANEGAIEGATFSISGGRISETQASAVGGRYHRDDVAGLLDPETAEIGAILRIDAKTSVGGTPWFLELEDGVRGYRLRLSDGVAVLQDAAGNTIESRSRGFSVGVEYRLRIARTGPTTVDVTIDGASVFGEREISEFAASANKRYGFGYRSESDPSNDWTVSWREVGPRPVLKFDLSTLLGLTEAVPHDVRVVYRENAGRTSPSFWTGSRNEVSISDAFGVPIPLDLELSNFLVGIDPDEFVSDLRVVDDGTLDRVFVANLVGVLRPSGERVFVRFVDFQDLFRNRDLRYWEEIAGTVELLPDDGRAELEDVAVATVVHANMPLASTWSQFTAAAQYSLRDEVSGKWGELRFHVQDDLNFHAVRIDPGARTVALQKVIAGARSTIFTHGPMDVFYPGVLYMTHVTTEDVVGGVLIKVYLDGNYLGESIETDFDEGTLGLAVELGQRLSTSFVDLVSCPFPSARVGPGIDASPTWSDDCANP